MFSGMDVLRAKEAKLAKLARQSNSAVSAVQKTIKDLNVVNDNIKLTIEEIDTYVRGLETTRNSLGDTYDKNQRIMKNFESLLCVD